MHLMVVLMVANSISWTAGAASGQPFPAKPMRIVPGDVTGGTDFASRLIGSGLTAALGQPVIVDNRGAAGAAIAGQTVAKA